ncbi:hypothetical protein I5M27_10690 [Adhaeribacter sp. BT258]|uniref:Uncharacterized protein n=1 Tax=Adhaeribacter terrigena TaxID=2793070 RepID=A0ABS1C232_9BACT|nr:hypothetical protein [Adhaeribacter terrigena]MBK0403453.1 hypothetical protein [Adhaeribacter terrigena]
MQLLDNETIIASANQNLLILTNLRVIQQAKAENAKFYKSIYLHDVTSIAIDKKKIDLLLYLTLLMLVNGMASMIGERIVEGVMGKPTDNLSIIFGITSFFFYLIYSFYSISIISIATPSLRIDQQISSRDNATEFIFKVEQAKLAARQNPL